MLDTSIAGAIFDIILQSKQPLKLILVGDDDQLPSIGPGQILTDLLTHHQGVVRLTEVKRQTGASNIPEFAKMIREGNFPEKEWFKDKDDIYLIEPESDVDMIKKLRLMLSRRKQNYNDLDDFQILTPYVNQSQQAKMSSTKNYDTCDMINHYTQEFFNPPYYDESKPNDTLLKELLFKERNDGRKDNNIKRFVNNGVKINDERKEGRLFRVNDRVVCNTNLSENIANGSVGTLIQIGRQGSDNIKDWILLVQFDNFSEPIEFEYKDWGYLDIAYAMTIHKSQGSEYQNVFLTLTRPSRLNDSFLNRNIIYTAVTRAKNMILLLGSYQNFATATLNKQRERKTGLAEMLKTGRELKIKTT
jgi:exodeoxyribonuclease V alpha subunit